MLSRSLLPLQTDNVAKRDGVKNAEKGAEHGHLRDTVGQRSGGRGAVDNDDGLLSVSGGLIQVIASTVTC